LSVCGVGQPDITAASQRVIPGLKLAPSRRPAVALRVFLESATDAVGHPASVVVVRRSIPP
jgi:hypothetical protein